MGFPSSIVYGQDLTNEEYKALKKRTGEEIAKVLTDRIETEEYKQLPDKFKIKRIEQLVDLVKEQVKYEMFPEKQYESFIKGLYKSEEGMSEQEAKIAAKEFINKGER
jgi:hypothetical protein